MAEVRRIWRFFRVQLKGTGEYANLPFIVCCFYMISVLIFIKRASWFIYMLFLRMYDEHYMLKLTLRR